MKLYMHPVSTTSRPVVLFVAEKRLPVEQEVVDLMTGAHHQEPFTSINPNRMVPVLEDGDFRLTESSAILKYLADKFELPEYPKELRERARVNEMMDWLNSNLYRDFGYGLIYPQIFPHHRRPSEEVQAGTVRWGKEASSKWLAILDAHWIGSGKPYLCGSSITIADYFGAGLLTAGEAVGCTFANYPNVQRWLENMKKLQTWGEVNSIFYGFVGSLRGRQFEAA
jgi:glutathione S-transferase